LFDLNISRRKAPIHLDLRRVLPDTGLLQQLPSAATGTVHRICLAEPCVTAREQRRNCATQNLSCKALQPEQNRLSDPSSVADFLNRRSAELGQRRTD
jgi:hypothetical protein